MALAAAPMFFYKRGKGRYRRAPPQALAAALASVDRKKREAEQMLAWSDELRSGRLPDAFRAKLDMLLYRPDKNSIEWKTLAAACDAAQKNPLTLLAACGAIPSSHDYHFNAFLAQAFPQGISFGTYGAPAPVPELPEANVRAFSIDDATTTEVDDAFSVRELPNGHYEVGVHIAAPALGIPRGSPLDALRALAALHGIHAGSQDHDAARRCGRRVHAGGRPAPPALSLYAEVAPDGTLLRHETRVNRIPVAARSAARCDR